MTPTYLRKHGARYRYYICHALLQSRKTETGSVARVSATEIEEAVLTALPQNEVLSQDEANITPELLQAVVKRITLSETELKIELTDKSLGKKDIISVQWSKKTPAAPKGVLHTPVTSAKRLSPETRDALLSAIARARKWITNIESGTVSTVSEIAEQEGNVERHIRLLLPLAFTPPALIKSLAEGNVLHDLAVTRLATQVPFKW